MITLKDAQERYPEIPKERLRKYCLEWNGKHAERRLEGRHWVWYISESVVDDMAKDYSVPSHLIPATKAAKIAGVTSATVYEWCGNGYVIAEKKVDKWFVDEADLRRFIALRAKTKRRQNWAGTGGNQLSPMTRQIETTNTTTKAGASICPAFKRNLDTARLIAETCARVEKERYGVVK